VDQIEFLSRHFSALFRTATTGFGTLLAMLIFMLTTFFCTVVTGFCAKFTYLMHERRLLLFHTGTQLTNICTIQTALDTLPHHLQIFFFKTGTGTVGTC